MVNRIGKRRSQGPYRDGDGLAAWGYRCSDEKRDGGERAVGAQPRNSGGDPGLYCSYLNNPLGMALGGYGRVSARSPELR